MEEGVRKDDYLPKMIYNLKKEYNPYTYLVFAIPVLFEIMLFMYAYYRRKRLTSDEEAKLEFENCNKQIWPGHIILCFCQIGTVTQISLYGKTENLMVFVLARITATIISTPFLILYRRNNVTMIEYFYRRFNRTKLTWFIVVIGFLIINMETNLSVPSFYNTMISFGYDGILCMAMYFVYSTFLVAFGGLRGFIWIGSFRFIVTFLCHLAVIVYCGFKVANQKLLQRLHTLPFNLSSESAIFFLSITIGQLILQIGVCTASKYVNAFSKTRYAMWSVFLSLIPYVMNSLLRDSLYILAYLYYSQNDCDPVKSGRVARHLLMYTFISDISGNNKVYRYIQILFGISSYIIGSFSITDSLMTAWYYLSFIQKRIATYLQDENFFNPLYFHIMVAGGLATTTFKFIPYYTDSTESFKWVSYFIEHITTGPAAMVVALMIAAAIVPYMSSLAAWNIPLLMAMVAVICPFREMKTPPGPTNFAYMCSYQGESCNNSCTYKCRGRDFPAVATSLVSVFILTIISIILVSAFSSKSYRNLDQDLYIDGAVRFWMKRRKRRKRTLIHRSLIV